MRAKTTHRTVVTVLFFTIVLCLLTAGGCKNASKRAYRAYSGTVSVSLGLDGEGGSCGRTSFSSYGAC